MAEEIGSEVFEFSAVADGAEFELAEEFGGKIDGRFHGGSLPVSKVTCQWAGLYSRRRSYAGWWIGGKGVRPGFPVGVYGEGIDYCNYGS